MNTQPSSRRSQPQAFGEHARRSRAKRGLTRIFLLPAALFCAGQLTAHLALGQDLVVDGGTTNLTGGTTNAFANTYVGQSTSGNQLNVSGSGTLLTNSSELQVGSSGSSNRLVISDGGTVVASTGGTIGFGTTSSNNSVTVSGTGSAQVGGSVFTVGRLGAGNSLVVSNGGTVISSASFTIIGNVSSNNLALVTGAGSVWTNSGTLTVGRQASGNSLVISNGGLVASTSTARLGDFGVSSNSVVVTGPGSLWTNNGGILVGDRGIGSRLVISNGGRVVSSSTNVVGNQQFSSNNSVLVTGTDSTWNATDLYIGYFGLSSGNRMEVRDGGLVSNNIGTIGQNNSSSNSVLVTDSGSRWINASNLTVGVAGLAGSLVISNGGFVSSANGAIASLSSASNNSAVITGTGSIWTNAGTLTVGTTTSNGSFLAVVDGGTVAASNIVVAATLDVGRFGTNDAGGTISASGISVSASRGVLNFNQTNDVTVSAPISGGGRLAQLGSGTTTLGGTNSYTGGTLVSSGALRGSSSSLQGSITNNASVIFNQSGSGTYSGQMSGSGALQKTGLGTLTVTGSNSYSGATAVQAGALVVNGAVSNSTVTVANGATLGGSGSVRGIVLNLGGTISPGNSPGTLNVLSNAVWNPGANYNWQIYNASGTQGGTNGWDWLNVSGSLDLSALSAGNEFNINLWSLSGISPDANGSALFFTNTTNYTWTILTASNGITGFSADKFIVNTGVINGTGGFANALGGGTFSLAQSGNDLNLVFTAAGPAAVPEPGTWAAAALLVGTAAFMRWRKCAKVS